MNIVKESILRNNLGCKALADLADQMQKMGAQNPAIEEAGTAFENAVGLNPTLLKALNKQLVDNPALSGDVQKLLLKNPKAFEAALPYIIKNPNQATKLIAEASQAPGAGAPQKAAQPAPAPAAAPKKETAPIAAVAAPAAPEKAEAQTSAQAGSATLDAKISEITKAEGFDGLMERVGKNPRLNDMFKNLMDSNGDPADREKTVDGILDHLKQNPHMFRDLNNTIDKHPGVVTTLAGTFANDPQTGMAMIGMYSQLSSSGLFKMLNGLFGGHLDSIIEGIAGFAGKLLGGSGDVMVAADNTGGDLPRQALAAAGSDPAKTRLSTVSPDGNETVAQTEKNLRNTGEMRPNAPVTTAPVAPQT